VFTGTHPPEAVTVSAAFSLRYATLSIVEVPGCALIWINNAAKPQLCCIEPYAAPKRGTRNAAVQPARPSNDTHLASWVGTPVD